MYEYGKRRLQVKARLCGHTEAVLSLAASTAYSLIVSGRWAGRWQGCGRDFGGGRGGGRGFGCDEWEVAGRRSMRGGRCLEWTMEAHWIEWTMRGSVDGVKGKATVAGEHVIGGSRGASRRGYLRLGGRAAVVTHALIISVCCFVVRHS